MKTITDDRKSCYDLLFILEGQEANKGCVLKAECKCKGGRDGGCKHIGAAMYSPEELLNVHGANSATSGPCLWVKKAQSSTEPCIASNLIMEKSKVAKACTPIQPKY
jgi:hypothetical protein